MKKQKKQLIALCILLLICIVAWVGLTKWNKSQEQKKQEEEAKLNREKQLQQAMLGIQKKYGKNAVDVYKRQSISIFPCRRRTAA